jgi:hypothetical protein
MLLLALFFALKCFAASMPPKVLYHMGEKRYMQEDGNLGTVPEDVWAKSIMGAQTTFGLVPYRRGLYGGENFDGLEFYANMLMGSPKGTPQTPWMMRITIKDFCLRPEFITDLATDEKYLRWILAHINELLGDFGTCLNREALSCDEVIVGQQAVGNGREENLCDEFLHRFLLDTQPKIVRDSEWKQSWYLRDRDCIEAIDASPKAILETLAKAKWDWNSRRTAYTGPVSGGYGLSAIAMLVSALADSDGVEEALLEKLRAVTAASDIHLELKEDSPAWVKKSGPLVIDAFTRCQKLGRLSQFRGKASVFALSINALTNDKRLPVVAGLDSSMDTICR